MTREVAELASTANRANASFYTVDPRGLVNGPEAAHFRLRAGGSFNEWTFTAQSSLRSLAELTGGRAIVNRNKPRLRYGVDRRRRSSPVAG